MLYKYQYLAVKINRTEKVTINNCTNNEISLFKAALEESNLLNQINPELSTNPNLTYNIIEQTITKLKETYMPAKTTKFNRHKHTNNNLDDE